MRILVPASIDYDQLISKLENRTTKGDVFRFKVYYVLSRIHIYPEIHHYYKKRNFYRPINDTSIKKIVGDRHYRQIKKLLLDNEIIECNNEYHISKPKPMSKGYRLTDEYNTGKVRWVTISDNFRSEEEKEFEKKQDEINNQYRFILEMYNKYPLKVNLLVYDYLNNLKQGLIKLTKNEYQVHMVNNVIGRYIVQVEKMNKGEYNQKVSPSNHRLGSTFTNFPKLIRKFIEYNKQPLIGLDISASQPYILSSILDSKFYTNTTVGYNLYTIFNELYTTINTNILYNNKSISSCIMSGSSFSETEIDNLKFYQTKSFENDFYSFVSENCDPQYNFTRSDVKNHMLYYFFNDNFKDRLIYDGYKVINSVFPAMEKWITMAHKEFGGGSNFSKLLQRTESFLILKQISKEFISLRPNDPIFSIHDSLYTTEEGVYTLEQTMKYQLKKYVGIYPNIHIESNPISVFPEKEEINDIMEQIRTVKTEEDYNKIKGGVLKMFVDKGNQI